MKTRIFALLLVLITISALLTSCEGLRLFNNIWEFIFPNEGGDTNNFFLQIIFPNNNQCTSHVIVALDTVEPTCTAPGASGGQVCQKCSEVVVEQTVLPMLGHEFTDERDETCNRCTYTREVACQHANVETIDAVAPTCATQGRSEGKRCTDCQTIIEGFEIIQVISHTYDDRRDTECNECGYTRKVECLHEKTEEIPALSSTCTSGGLTAGVSCCYCGIILVEQEELELLPHVESDWIVDTVPTETENGERHTECTECGFIIRTAEIDVIAPDADANASQGLFFYLNEDNKSYALIGVGDCADEEIVIPVYYNGLPVTRIESGAFMDQKHITSVIIPNGVCSIGSGAFRGCEALVSVSVPDTVTKIEEYAFYGCVSLCEISIPEGVSAIEKYTFYGCVALVDTVLPDSLEKIGVYSFYYTGIKNLEIPANVKEIEGLMLCPAILGGGEYVATGEAVNITLFKGISKLGLFSFTGNTTVTFKGTASEWNNIIINPMNYNYKVICTDKTFTH